jgi:hypothetical protein
MAKEDWIAAIDGFNKTISFDPKNGHALLKRGNVYTILISKRRYN